ncbi:MAG: cytochrome c oxidase subunit II [candidate division Zixibacteria bacterium]|nr:cytochrome c oxidase subunit II [candidate division Zixibacteria bacterium]
MDSTGSFFLPPGSSTIASEVDAIFYFITYASIVIFGIVVFGMIYFSIKYSHKKSNAEELTPGISHNIKLELLWSIIPGILVMIVFFWGFDVYMKMNVVPKDAIEIKVSGQKWFWSFDYPEGITTVNELVVPLNKPVKLLMSSKDVIHSFFVPDFRIKMDVLPNRYTITWFEATHIGKHNLFCAEFCGDSHSDMIGTVRVVSEREYKEWLETSVESSDNVTPQELGAKLFVSKACRTCHSVEGKTLTGPHLDGVFGERIPLDDGRFVVVDENYIRESLLDPQASIVAGFQPVMPTYQGILKDRQVDALIAYIKSLKGDNK